MEIAASEAKEAVIQLLKQSVRPEFINRIDEIIMFLPLNKEEIKSIVQLQLKTTQDKLKENGTVLYIDDKAIEFITSAGFDPEFGARPIKRAIQRNLLNELSKKILSGSINKSEGIKISSDGDVLIFEN
jgi:ATP-dependent Clp protease ATP-binding subunit ClpB